MPHLRLHIAVGTAPYGQGPGSSPNAAIAVTSMARGVLPACGSARIQRRVGHGGGFRGGAADTGALDACSAVVFHEFQSVFADKTREHRGLVAAFGAESSPRGVHDPAEASTGTK